MVGVTLALIRRLTKEDADSLYRLRLSALQESPEVFGSTYEETLQRGVQSTRDRLRDEDTDFFYLGAFVSERLVGMVAVFREQGLKNQHRGNIISMYVAPELRGQGIGRVLISEAIIRARAVPGLEQLHLAVVTTNSSARALYAALGFERYGVEPHALKQGDHYWDEELMILRLY